MSLINSSLENNVFTDEKVIVWEEELLPGATFRGTRQVPRTGIISEIRFNIGEDEEGLVRVRLLKDYIEIVPYKSGWLTLMSPRPSWKVNIFHARNSPITFEAENLSDTETVSVQALVSIRYRLDSWEISQLGLRF